MAALGSAAGPYFGESDAEEFLADGSRRTCWSPEEDVKLIQLVETYGPQNWSLIAKSLGSGRNGKSCRLRWFNQLDPNLRKEPFSAEEEEIIIYRHAQLGNKWAAISKYLPGRTDNAIKNYWNGHLKKRLHSRASELAASKKLRALAGAALEETLLGEAHASPSPTASRSRHRAEELSASVQNGHSHLDSGGTPRSGRAGASYRVHSARTGAQSVSTSHRSEGPVGRRGVFVPFSAAALDRGGGAYSLDGPGLSHGAGLGRSQSVSPAQAAYGGHAAASGGSGLQRGGSSTPRRFFQSLEAGTGPGPGAGKLSAQGGAFSSPLPAAADDKAGSWDSQQTHASGAYAGSAAPMHLHALAGPPGSAGPKEEDPTRPGSHQSRGGPGTKQPRSWMDRASALEDPTGAPELATARLSSLVSSLAAAGGQSAESGDDQAQTAQFLSHFRAAFAALVTGGQEEGEGGEELPAGLGEESAGAGEGAGGAGRGTLSPLGEGSAPASPSSQPEDDKGHPEAPPSRVLADLDAQSRNALVLGRLMLAMSSIVPGMASIVQVMRGMLAAVAGGEGDGAALPRGESLGREPGAALESCAPAEAGADLLRHASRASYPSPGNWAAAFPPPSPLRASLLPAQPALSEPLHIPAPSSGKGLAGPRASPPPQLPRSRSLPGDAPPALPLAASPRSSRPARALSPGEEGLVTPSRARRFVRTTFGEVLRARAEGGAPWGGAGLDLGSGAAVGVRTPDPLAAAAAVRSPPSGGGAGRTPGLGSAAGVGSPAGPGKDAGDGAGADSRPGIRGERDWPAQQRRRLTYDEPEALGLGGRAPGVSPDANPLSFLALAATSMDTE